MAFRNQDLDSKLDGFGFIVPSREGSSVIAGTFASHKFGGRAPQDFTLLRLFVSNRLHPGLFSRDDAVLVRLACDEFHRLTGVGTLPVWSLVDRYIGDMPQYRVGHLSLVEEIQNGAKQFPGLFLTGNAYTGIGLPDCVRSAQETARKIHEYGDRPILNVTNEVITS